MDNESKLKAIIENAIDGIITIDALGVIESLNPAAAKIFGFTLDEVLGKNVQILMPASDHSWDNSYTEKNQQTLSRKYIGNGCEVYGKKKDGSTFPFLLSISEVKLENRIVFTGIIHDITQLKQAESDFYKLNTELEGRVQQRTSELFDAIKKLKKINSKQKLAEVEVRKALEKEIELNELKSRFITLASHEFRTPLSTILSSTALIAKYHQLNDSDKLNKHILRIKSSVTNLTVILNDFLSLSRLEEGVVSINPSYFNLQELCMELIEEMTPVIKEQQAVISKHEGVIQIFMDKNIIKNILLNLVSNAIKYSIDGIITIITNASSSSLLLQVKDEGIGIPQEDKQFLFTRFFRAHNAGNIQGTGLGLNIIKRYVELMGGDINMESEIGNGTVFTVKIPNLEQASDSESKIPS